jgi:hypothetical protein
MHEDKREGKSLGPIGELLKPIFNEFRTYGSKQVDKVEKALEEREKEILAFANQLKDLSEILQGELPILTTKEQIQMLFGASLQMIAGKLSYAKENRLMDPDKIAFYNSAFHYLIKEEPDSSFITRFRLLILQLRGEKIIW